jgi:hypothetical protein
MNIPSRGITRRIKGREEKEGRCVEEDYVKRDGYENEEEKRNELVINEEKETEKRIDGLMKENRRSRRMNR